MMNNLIGVKTDFSIGESLLQAKSLAEKAAELGFESVALADTMTVSGMVDFSNQMKEKGIKPIIGCTLRIFDDPTYRPPAKKTGEVALPNESFMPRVYIKSEKGFKSLLKFLSVANDENHYYYTARASMAELLELEDVIVTTGDMFGLFYHKSKAADYARLLHRRFGEDFLIEISPINTPLFDTLNKKALAFANEFGAKTIVSYPAFYEDGDKADSLDVYRAITGNGKMSSRSLNIPYVRDFAILETKALLVKTLQMSKRIFKDEDEDHSARVKTIFANQNYIADNAEYVFEKQAPCLPKMADDEFLTLAQEVQKGWKERFSKPVLGHKPSAEQMDEYKTRVMYELGVLKKMGFESYFLLTQDIVKWSKDNGIIVGPGRGSVGGSLVAYLLGITDVDPIRFNLLFERFINPDRIDLPDADLDFQSTRRHEVIERLVEKYGRKRVAGVSNYSSLASASALRDAGRVFELDNFELSCTKLVPKEHGQPVTLEEAAEAVPEIDKFKSDRPKIWKHATNLEGAMRSLGRHAAGIVVAGEDLTNRAVVETRSGEHVVNWDKRVVEDFGLIKMDILGLSTLDVLGLAAEYIFERHGTRINYIELPLDEPDVMRSFGAGETVAVFQFESSGMRRLLKDLAKREDLTFEDLSAATALYRPGPMDSGLLDQYVAVRKGDREPFYEHELMIPALSNTYGVIVYQEQVMQVARDLAGFTLAEADLLRKAMGKKDKEKMAKMREQWVTGCEKSGMPKDDAELLFDKIELFAGYAFNKSHSAEYSIISYWAMWLKVRYPQEFYAASMTVADDDEKLSSLVLDARARKIEVLPPDINYSSSRIEIDADGRLYAPFQAVKGISSNVADNIMKVRNIRKEGLRDAEGEWVLPPAGTSDFESSAEFEKYVTSAKLGAKINKTHREKLLRVGAFARVDGDKIPARHPDRVKDQVELMPGYSVDAVKADRGVNSDKLAQIKIIRMVEDMRGCEGCSLKGGVHVFPRIGKTPKFMVVFDAPNFKEEAAQRMFEGDGADIIKSVLKEVGLSSNDGYYTSLVKSPKSDKMLSNEQINGCSQYLMKEIEILKPPVIVTLGAAATRFFAPGIKGAGTELAGKVIYRADLDASIVFGINPGQVMFDHSKAKHLVDCFRQVAEIVS
jgi:DNA polymerase-3 subunit alpha